MLLPACRMGSGRELCNSLAAAQASVGAEEEAEVLAASAVNLRMFFDIADVAANLCPALGLRSAAETLRQRIWLPEPGWCER